MRNHEINEKMKIYHVVPIAHETMVGSWAPDSLKFVKDLGFKNQ
jgi:hypothetical protein